MGHPRGRRMLERFSPARDRYLEVLEEFVRIFRATSSDSTSMLYGSGKIAETPSSRVWSKVWLVLYPLEMITGRSLRIRRSSRRVGHGIARVDAQVQQGILNLGCITEDDGHLGLEIHADLDVPVDTVRQQVVKIVDQSTGQTGSKEHQTCKQRMGAYIMACR